MIPGLMHRDALRELSSYDVVALNLTRTLVNTKDPEESKLTLQGVFRRDSSSHPYPSHRNLAL